MPLNQMKLISHSFLRFIHEINRTHIHPWKTEQLIYHKGMDVWRRLVHEFNHFTGKILLPLGVMTTGNLQHMPLLVYDTTLSKACAKIQRQICYFLNGKSLYKIQFTTFLNFWRSIHSEFWNQDFLFRRHQSRVNKPAAFSTTMYNLP